MADAPELHGVRLPLRHEILFMPIAAIEAWPELAAEWDRRWTERYPPGNKAWKTNGEWFREMDALALEIMEAAGVVPPKPAPENTTTL